MYYHNLFEFWHGSVRSALFAAEAAGPQRGQGGVHRDGRDVHGSPRGIQRLFHQEPARRPVGTHLQQCGRGCEVWGLVHCSLWAGNCLVRFGSFSCSLRICSNRVMPSYQSEYCRNVLSTSLNPRHKKWRQFWKQKCSKLGHIECLINWLNWFSFMLFKFWPAFCCFSVFVASKPSF